MYKNRKMRYNKSTTLLESTDINCKEFSEINQFQFKATKERKTNWIYYKSRGIDKDMNV